MFSNKLLTKKDFTTRELAPFLGMFRTTLLAIEFDRLYLRYTEQKKNQA